MSVWNTLSAIDCSEHIEQKGQFSYLSWTWAWAMVCDKYPLSTYALLDDTVYPDGTMEVRVSVTIEGITHTMWLPVLDFKNKAITNPNAFDVNSARMRCLVKCLAMFGLGHYIYAGESVPKAPIITDEQLEEMKLLLANGSDAEFTVALKSMTDEAQVAFFNSAPTGEKTKFKQKMRDKEGAAMAQAKSTAIYVREALEDDDAACVKEALTELDTFEKMIVWAMFNEVEQLQIQEIMK